ncbi:ribosomal protein L17 [Aureococcus anophagefferens]|uniref:Ribosomal protein L17 n=1 Tax=Aureococcus anophagefferens TaxID=44056 RepID=A0ABR1G014_AURAN
MLRNMVTSLIKWERIRTTTPKAKTLRPYAERLITYAKKGDLHGMRLAARVVVREQSALRKLFEGRSTVDQAVDAAKRDRYDEKTRAQSGVRRWRP